MPSLLTIGNAILDVVAATDEATMAAAGHAKGGMTLVDEAGLARVEALMSAPSESAGGSAANTARGFAALGGQARFVGKLGNDRAASVYAADIAEAGVAHDVPPSFAAATARSAVLVTDDGERTMATHLGACRLLTSEDVDRAFSVGPAPGAVLVEGYLWDCPTSAFAAIAAVDRAGAAQATCALSLSDPGCATRWNTSFRSLVSTGQVDVVFANEREFAALWPEHADLSRPPLSGRTTIVVTRGERGCRVMTADGETFDEPAIPVHGVVDTTGAGDMFAAGYLFGLASTGDHRRAAKLGGLLASNVIMHRGATVRLGRDERDYANGLLSVGEPEAA